MAINELISSLGGRIGCWKVERLKGDVSRIVECQKISCEDRTRKKLETKYKIRSKCFDMVVEELK